MNKITEQHYILYPSPTLLKVYDKCSGKGCTDIGKTLLKIVYINKTGHFCDSCTEDLLHHDLAVLNNRQWDCCLKETKAFSRELKLCDGRLDYNDKYHHYTYLIIQKRNARQGATKIMSDLISALRKRIIQIAQIENRPSFCCEFVPYFELDGGIYSIAYGTMAAVKSHRLEMMSDNE